MRLIQDGHSYNTVVQTFYIESIEELKDIPEDALPGSIAEINIPNDFRVFMKMESGQWNEL